MAVTQQREQSLASLVVNYSSNKQDKFLKDGRWTFPETMLNDTIDFHVEQNRNNAEYGKTLRSWLKDAWGREFRLVKVEKKREHQTGWSQFDYYEIVSAGPDGKFGTADDVKPVSPNEWHLVQWWWLGDTSLLRKQLAQQMMPRRGGFGRRFALEEAEMMRKGEAMPMMAPRAAGALERDGRDFDLLKQAMKEDKAAGKPGEGGGQGGGGGAPPIKVREYFPETLLWQPALITDDKGVATLPLTFADSITTWRLSAVGVVAGRLARRQVGAAAGLPGLLRGPRPAGGPDAERRGGLPGRGLQLPQGAADGEARAGKGRRGSSCSMATATRASLDAASPTR